MTDSNPPPIDAPTKRTSRLRQPPAPEAEAGTQEPTPLSAPEATATVDSHAPEPSAPPVPDMSTVAPAAPPPPPFVLRDPNQDQRNANARTAAAPTPGRVQLPGSALCKHDVVQIIDPKHVFYGLFFVVGDVLRDRVHGYHMVEGHGRKEYVSVDSSACYYIGEAKIRSQNPCSPKWIADNRPS